MGDAHLDPGAAVVTEEANPRGAAGAWEDLDTAAGEADAGAVEALDHRLLGRPAPGEAFGVARAVGDLGGCVNLVQEAAAGPPHRERHPVYGNGIDPDSLHGHIVRPWIALIPSPPEGRGWERSTRPLSARGDPAPAGPSAALLDGDGLGQVAGLVHVLAQLDCHVVGEQL